MMAKLDGHKLAGNRLDPLSSNPICIIESATGEKYSSPSAMAKHEAGESASERKMEYGK